MHSAFLRSTSWLVDVPPWRSCRSGWTRRTRERYEQQLDACAVQVSEYQVRLQEAAARQHAQELVSAPALVARADAALYRTRGRDVGA